MPSEAQRRYFTAAVKRAIAPATREDDAGKGVDGDHVVCPTCGDSFVPVSAATEPEEAHEEEQATEEASKAPSGEGWKSMMKEKVL